MTVVDEKPTPLVPLTQKKWCRAHEGCPSLRIWLVAFTVFASAICSGSAAMGQGDAVKKIDAVERLKLENLARTHEALGKLQAERKELTRTGPYRDFRANLHVHSAFSHDSRGTIEEIVAAAKKVGTKVLMFTEHPAPKYDFIVDGHQGLKDGVLLIPGAEANGFLAFPRKSIKGMEATQKQEFADIVLRTGGLVFLSHLEERMDWNIRGMTGVEIYNTHAIFKDQKNLVASLKSPFGLIKMEKSVQKFPQESYSALHEYPANYLKRFDELCRATPQVGVSANDAHQNVGVRITMKEKNQALIESVLGEKLMEIDASLLAAIHPIPKDAKPGTVLFQFRLDGYEYALRHVGTHLLMRKQSVEDVWDALEKGRAFVAFDWMADASGFDFSCQQSPEMAQGKENGDAGKSEMGANLAYKAGLRFQGQAPLPGRWKWIKDGKVAAESTGSQLDVAATGPGVYRAEVWLNVAGEERVWILSNPIYLK